MVLLGADLEKQDAAEKEESEEENRLSALLTPSRLPEVQSVSQLAPSPANMGGSSPDGQAADAAARSGDVASTSMEASRPQLPPELTERPPGEVEPQVQVRTKLFLTKSSFISSIPPTQYTKRAND